MAENLPLIPEKQSALCGDVQAVLRDVFRELDYLPPLVSEPLPRVDQNKNEEDSLNQQWINNLSAEQNELYIQEEELKREFAKRLAREPLPNIYKLHSPAGSKETVQWRRERGIIGRKDLRPSLHHNATRDSCLWIKNILNRSSGDLSKDTPKEVPKQIGTNLKMFVEGSLQSISMGEVIPRPPPPPRLPELPPPEPEYIVCIPPQLEFVNFTVGSLHTQSLRLVNTSKLEVRLSIRPPARRELSVQLCARLVLSAGAEEALLLHFRAQDVRALADELLVRVSAGRSVVVPIRCYMEPPLLDVLIPITPSSLPSSADDFDICDVLDLGAKLLGDTHRTPMIFHCGPNHAAFFLLSEDSWLNSVIDITPTENSNIGQQIGVASDDFWLSPAHWAGGGTVVGLAVCRATSPGLHTSAFRILCSTAIVRSLNLVADAMLFNPNHVTIKAHEKDYDICSTDDPACEYYVNLGVAFPHRSLTASIEIVNHSPIAYEYYWSMRRWGISSCQETLQSEGSPLGEQELYPGAPQLSPEDKDNDLASYRNVQALQPLPGYGSLPPRCSRPGEVFVPDVGGNLGIQRAVLMLVLKDIPKESFPRDLDPIIVKSNVIVFYDSIPGPSSAWSQKVCDVVCAQVEVWWEVTPVCFVVDQPLLILPHSRRIKSLTIPIRVTQVSGVAGVSATLSMEDSDIPEKQISLKPGHTTVLNIKLPLKNMPDEHPEKKMLHITSDDGEWSMTTRVHTSCITRHPALRPAIVWLGVVPPGARVQAQITIKNDTHQHIYWWATSWRWWRERPVGAACTGRAACGARGARGECGECGECGACGECGECRQRACSCAALRPTRGALRHGEEAVLTYHVNAPHTDGSVATLVQVRRTAADMASMPAGVGSDGRATLVAYRVAAVRLMLRVLPCFGDKRGSCETCVLDEGVKSSVRGTSVLRPSAALTVGRCACYRLECSNLTPIPTTLRWEPPVEGEDELKVTFIPNDIEVGAHAVVEIKVVLKPLKVCGRRIFVHRASVEYAHTPVYLLIDTAIKGLEITIEVPLGGDDQTDSFVVMRRSQAEIFSSSLPDPNTLSMQEYFEENDRKIEVRQENICHCRYKMVYIPPKKPHSPPKGSGEEYSIDIVTEPPSLTRVCACTLCSKPVISENQEPICLQFQNVPIRTVRSKTIIIRNLSAIRAQWSAAVRRWPRRHVRSLAADQWASDIRDPGIAVQCIPSQGVLTSRGRAEIAVSIYADCWGLYRDQILIHVEKLEPIILDLWVEAVGCPLEFAIKPGLEDTPPTLWMSSSDPERVVNVTNTSRTDLVVQVLTTEKHGHPHHTLPFRLYIRFYDVPPRTCPCCKTIQSESVSEEESDSSVIEEMDTGIEVILSADYGLQRDDYYQVDPVETTLPRGGNMSWRVRLLPAVHPVPPGILLLRTEPVLKSGDNWYRATPAPQSVLLRATNSTPCLQLSPSEIRVSVCALDLPFDDAIRIRKAFIARNAGAGPLAARAPPAGPWRLVARSSTRQDVTRLHLPPRTSTELCVELTLRTEDAWPKLGEAYPQQQETTTSLNFFSENHVILASMQLTLELERPIVQVAPSSVDFGRVTVGDARKDYITVTHTSRKTAIDLVTNLEGSTDFRVYPRSFTLEPGTKGRVYVQYISRWRSSPSEATLHISAASEAGSWCTATVSLLATPTRDWGYHMPVHDHTDDGHLLPDSVAI